VLIFGWRLAVLGNLFHVEQISENVREEVRLTPFDVPCGTLILLWKAWSKLPNRSLPQANRIL
jgi:hypothetical protein